jgi:hypothetical protein
MWRGLRYDQIEARSVSTNADVNGGTIFQVPLYCNENLVPFEIPSGFSNILPSKGLSTGSIGCRQKRKIFLSVVERHKGRS